MKNSELIHAAKDRLCELDRQRQHILRMHSVPMPCPNCGHQLNVFEAQGVSIDDYKVDGNVSDEHHRCTRCKRALRHSVPWVAMGNPWHWTLVPEAA